MRVMVFETRLIRAVKDGLVAVALVDREGVTISCIGAIGEEEAMPLAAYVMDRLRTDDLTSRLFEGEILTLALDDRAVAVGVAGRQLFVVAVLGDWTAATQALVRELRDDIDGMLPEPDFGVDAAPWARAGGSTSGPAELPLIEHGITVRRERGKA
jgi:hypothetical protein